MTDLPDEINEDLPPSRTGAQSGGDSDSAGPRPEPGADVVEDLTDVLGLAEQFMVGNRLSKEELSRRRERIELAAAHRLAAGDAPILPDLPDDVRIPDDIGDITERDEDLLPSQTGSLQVISGIDIVPGSPYIAEVRPTDDVAISLTRDKALAYAAAVWAAGMRAVYLAGVRAQMRDVLSGRGRSPGQPDAEETARRMVREFAQELPPLDVDATAPLQFEPDVRRSTGQPVVRILLDGKPHDIWSPDSARHHARCVIDVAIGADLDTAYRTYAAGVIGVEEQRARAMVHDLGKYLARFDDPDPGADDTPPTPRRPRVPGPPPGARPAGGKKKGKRR